MKKVGVLFLMLFVLVTVRSVESATVFRITEETKTTTYIDGIRHQSLEGTINYNGTESKQRIQYLGGDQFREDVSIVSADNYSTWGWGKGDLEMLKDNIHGDYDNYQVVGGVNGDFFGAYGIPIEAYIRDFHVISAGLGTNRTVIGFKDNGEVVFNRPSFDGYHIQVFNEFDELKHSIDIDKINQLPSNEEEVSVFFDNFDGVVSTDYEKNVLKVMESHGDDYGQTYYVNGMLKETTTNEVSVNELECVIVGAINHDELITEHDYVVIHKKLVDGWEDVRFTIAGWEILVEDGKATEVFTEGAGPSYRHPRTAVGIKEDGTVFFVVVDGRDDDARVYGMTEYELSNLMLHYGAVDAFNLDGGGSTAMLLKDNEGNYDYVNVPSDGTPRPVTNGVFFAIGKHKERVDAIWPDNREVLDTPFNIHIDLFGKIDFDDVTNALGYELVINDVVYELDESFYQMELEKGTYDIKVRAKGDKTDYKNSLYSESVTYHVYSDEVESVIDYFNRYKTDEATD